jgi:hypothetical protein
MNKKTTLSKAANKVMLSLVYFLFFTVQLHFQYQSASSVDFVDNTFSVHHANPQLHVKGNVIQQDVSFVKHNRLNKRYHPEWPITIVDFFNYQSPIYPTATKQYFSVAYLGSNIFLSTYLLRGPPSNV